MQTTLASTIIPHFHNLSIRGAGGWCTSLPWIYFYAKPNDDGDDGGDACGDPLPNIDKVL